MKVKLTAGLTLAACAVLSGAVGFAEEVKWTPIFKGIELTTFQEEEPLQTIIAARVDLTAPGVSVVTTEQNPDFAPDERETVRETVPMFLERKGLALAVNGDFYTPFGNRTITKPGDANLRGLNICDGFVVSQPEPGFPSFVVKKDGTLDICQYSVGDDFSDITLAISGPSQVLKDGEILPQSDAAAHPRTAVGYSKDGKYLYLTTIDGRRPGYSVGASFEDVAKALVKLGAANGLCLDGGGSTTMAARGANGKPAILNWPINSISPDGLRFNGNSLGVTAEGEPLTSFDEIVTIHNTGEPVEWTPAYDGVEIATWIEYDDPLQRIFAARVDMTVDGVALRTTPPNENFAPEKRETWRMTTAKFLAENDLALAVNSNFYSPFNAQTIANEGDSNVFGLAVCDGFVESQPQPNYPSFIQKKDGTLEIRQVEPGESLDEINLAVSGNRIVLKDGEIVPDPDLATHPRTAVGISADKRYVYFVVIDGRQKGYSVGAGYADVAKALMMCGASDGLNLDGGGSTTMAIRDADGDPLVLNRPCNSTRDMLRNNGNSIGVTAKGALKTTLIDGRAKVERDVNGQPKGGSGKFVVPDKAEAAPDGPRPPRGPRPDGAPRE